MHPLEHLLSAAASLLQESNESTSHLESWIFWVFGGGVCSLVVGAIGGGLKAFSVTIPQLNLASRVSLGLVGLGLVSCGLWFGPIAEANSDDDSTSLATQDSGDGSGTRTIKPGTQQTFDGLIVKVDGQRIQLEPGATKLRVPADAEVSISKKELGFRRETILRPRVRE